MTFKYKNLRTGMLATLGASILVNDCSRYFNHVLIEEVPRIATIGLGATMVGKSVVDLKDIYTSIKERSAPSDEENHERLKEGVKNVIFSVAIPFALDISKGVLKMGYAFNSEGVSNFINKSIETINGNSFVVLTRGVDDILLVTGLSMLFCGALGYMLKETKR